VYIISKNLYIAFNIILLKKLIKKGCIKNIYISPVEMEEEKEMDAYLEARSHEREAREEEKGGNPEAAIELWKRYAEVKENKGSYFLCIYGHFNVARICDKVQRWKEAAEYFEAASKFAEKIHEFSLWALLMNLACQMHEKAGDYEACRNGYETIGNFFCKMAPIKAWKKNHEYWKEQGETDDAEWSLKRIDTYRTIQNSE
jgi:tetratricopeptide (TPR) repeat protein